MRIETVYHKIPCKTEFLPRILIPIMTDKTERLPVFDPKKGNFLPEVRSGHSSGQAKNSQKMGIFEPFFDLLALVGKIGIDKRGHVYQAYPYSRSTLSPSLGFLSPIGTELEF